MSRFSNASGKRELQMMRNCTKGGAMGQTCLYDVQAGHGYKMRHDYMRHGIQTDGRSISETLSLAGGKILYPPPNQFGNLDDEAIPPHNDPHIDRVGEAALPLPPPQLTLESQRTKDSGSIPSTSTHIATAKSGNENQAAATYFATEPEDAGTASPDNGSEHLPSTRPPPPPAGAQQQQQQEHHQQKQQHQQRQHHHALGAMFVPELDKAGVVRLVSEVLCRPGYTTGPQDEKRLLRQMRNGRVDLRTMSRLLRWLQRDGAKQELRERGVRFIGPSAGVQPYTTGMGISWLLQEVANKHPAGSRIVVCFSSSYDVCAGTIAGLLTDTTTATPPHTPPTTPSTCSSSSPSSIYRRSTNLRSTEASEWGEGGVRVSGRAGVDGNDTKNRAAVALLFDERPKHHCPGGPSSDSRSGSVDTGCGVGDSWEGVSRMGVREWVEAYGECDGPMLAAWVFQDSGMK